MLVCLIFTSSLWSLPSSTDGEKPIEELRIGERLARSPRIELDLATVQTNILVFRLAPGAPDAATLVERCRQREVLVMAFRPRTLRAVTHLDVSPEQCARAAEILAEVAEQADKSR